MAIGDYYTLGNGGDKLYHWSAMTSTLRDSLSVSSIGTYPLCMEWDGTDIHATFYTNWIKKLSGKFTTTVKTSLNAGSFDTIPGGISEDGTDTVVGGDQADKHYKLSGQYSSTIRDSRVAVNQPFGMSWDGTDINYSTAVGDRIYWGSGTFTTTIKSSANYTGVDSSLCDVCWDGTNTPFVGFAADKMYLSSGRHTTTLKDSVYIGAIDNHCYGMTTEDYESRLGLGGDPQANTLWCGRSADKLYMQSGQFTSTLKTSESVGGVDTIPRGITTDGTDTGWTGNQADKLYLTSGTFSSTLKTSQSVSAIDTQVAGQSWDGTNTSWCGYDANKLYLQSGQFTSTLKTSYYTGSGSITTLGINWDGTNTGWTHYTLAKLVLQSGQFTSTVKQSVGVGGVDIYPYGHSYTGTDTLWAGEQADKLYMQSGQFTSTLKTSVSVGSIDLTLSGIETTDYSARLGLGAYPDATYDYYSFEIDNTNVDSNLTDFPVRCDLANLPTAVREWLNTELNANGDGIRVTDSSNTVLNYTLENFAKSGGVVTGELVFKCSPTASTALECRLFAHSAAANAENQSGTYGAYSAAWNFEQDPSGAAPQLTDITGNGYDGTSSGSMTSGDLVSSGLFGSSIDLDGYDDDFDCGNLPSTTTDTWSCLFWVLSDLATDSSGLAIANQDGAGYDDSFQLGLVPEGTSVNTANRLGCNHQDTATNSRTIVEDTTDLTTATWYQVAATSDGSTHYLYVNGSQVDSTAKSGTYLNLDSQGFAIGRRRAGGRQWNGQMCEGVFDETTLSAAWIKFDYYNMTQSDNELDTFTFNEAGGGGSPVTANVLRSILNSQLRQVV